MKQDFKKLILPIAILIVLFILLFSIVTSMEYQHYGQVVNRTISSIVDKVLLAYPNVEESEIIELLQNKTIDSEDILKKYGYSDEIQVITKLQDNMNDTIIMNIVIFSVLGVIIIAILIIYLKNQNKKVNEISQYLNELNHKNYQLNIKDNSEDELSKLRNELYKTTILLKEAAENSEKEKSNLENSLADISHQLKTPLTSIRIMLDNIEENPNMSNETRTEFIRDISRQIDWISSLVISLLKLAKFDAGSIVMKKEVISLKQLMDTISSNLAIILELKNIHMIENIDDSIQFESDYQWQLEAFTNIIKNAIEHSRENSNIYVEVEDNSLFLKIIIRDEGEGIDKQDIKHIFDRFYKAKNSSEESIGIGLSLSKTIIEKANGYIKVSSVQKQGTTFEIKYLKM